MSGHASPLNQPRFLRTAEVKWGDIGVDVAFLALTAVCCFWGLEMGPFRDNNEALYADIARTMSAGGSWIVPHLDGVPYIEKPPALYWLMALSFKLFGIGTWQARFPDALSAWLISVGLIRFGHLVNAPVAGRVAALVTGTAVGWVLLSRTILFDPLLSLFWLTAVAMSYLAVVHSDRPKLRLAAIALALAVLTKGPVALVLVSMGLIPVWLWPPLGWTRNELLRFFLEPWALFIFLIVTVPWHLAATLDQPGFEWFYFVNETVSRFLGTRIPADYHTGAWWYYFPRLAIGLFQWLPVLVMIALSSLLFWKQPANVATRVGQWSAAAAALLLLFFSMAADKGAYYLFPAVPLIAWAAGILVQRTLEGDCSRPLARATAWGMTASAIGIIGLWMVASESDPLRLLAVRDGFPSVLTHQAEAALLVAASISGMGAWMAHRERLFPALWLFGAAAVPWIHLSAQIDQARGAVSSQADVGAYLRQTMAPLAAVYVWKTFEDHNASLLMYGIPRLNIIDSVSADLLFGCAQQPDDSPCVNVATVRSAIQAGRSVAIWVDKDRLDELVNTGLVDGLIAKQFRRSVVFESP